jgi:hypothetical protein
MVVMAPGGCVERVRRGLEMRKGMYLGLVLRIGVCGHERLRINKLEIENNR